MIIFLNGASSTGKSTIAREMMRQSDQPFLYYSIDHLVNFWIDEKFVAFEDEPKEWFFHQHFMDDDGRSVTQIVDGPNAKQLHWDMIEALMVLIAKGYDLIIDEVLWDPAIFQRYAPALAKANKVYVVKVICDLIEAERRESRREDRYEGLARSLYAQVYTPPPQYDFDVDTTYTSAHECAKSILQFVEKERAPRAFLDYLKQKITFTHITVDHYALLEKWHNVEHVAKWWGEGKAWHYKDIEEKYRSYTQGFKLVDTQKKPILGFIILCAEHPIGYIQCYNAYDFPRQGYELQGLPSSLAALDMYIGDKDYVNKGLGPSIIEQYLKAYVWPYFSSCFVDPDTANVQAVKAYEKAGFKVVKQMEEPAVTWMLKKQ